MDEAKLTLKQRKFLKYYFESGNASESALKAGYAHRQRGSELVSKSVIQGAYQELLDKQGITDNKLNQVLADGLGATKTEKVGDKFIEVPDHAIKHRYLETGLKLKGQFINKHGVEVEPGDSFKELLMGAARRSKGIE